jgi:hypothetical protein
VRRGRSFSEQIMNNVARKVKLDDSPPVGAGRHRGWGRGRDSRQDIAGQARRPRPR